MTQPRSNRVLGDDVAACAARVPERIAQRPLSLEEISGPIADQFRQSGMSEDEQSDLLETAKHVVRRRRS